MPGITLSLRDAKNIAAALVPHASGDKVTPVLMNIAFGGSLGNYAVATNRYTVGRYDLTNIIDDMPEETFLIPAKVFSIVRQIGPATLPDELYMDNYQLRIETLTTQENVDYILLKVLWHYEDGSDMVHFMRTWRLPNWGGSHNFPPVHRFFDDAVLSTDRVQANLSAKYLDPFVSYAKHIDRPLLFSMIEPGAGIMNRTLSPVLVEIGHRFKGFIQPVTRVAADTGVDILKANAERLAETADATTLQKEGTE